MPLDVVALLAELEREHKKRVLPVLSTNAGAAGNGDTADDNDEEDDDAADGISWWWGDSGGVIAKEDKVGGDNVDDEEDVEVKGDEEAVIVPLDGNGGTLPGVPRIIEDDGDGDPNDDSNTGVTHPGVTGGESDDDTMDDVDDELGNNTSLLLLLVLLLLLQETNDADGDVDDRKLLDDDNDDELLAVWPAPWLGDVERELVDEWHDDDGNNRINDVRISANRSSLDQISFSYQTHSHNKCMPLDNVNIIATIDGYLHQ
jgi:hypothetical protein